MRRHYVIWLAAALAICLFSQTAHAGGMFGKQEDLTVIEKTTDPEYELGYKVTMIFVFGGVYVHDDGYVLIPANDHKKYIPLDADKIHALQATGELPNPLPHYSVSIFQYLFGYSLWIIIGVIVIFSTIGKVFKKTPAAPVGASPTDGPKTMQ